MNTLCTNSKQALSLSNARYSAQSTVQTRPTDTRLWVRISGASRLLSKFKDYVSRKRIEHTDRQAFNYLLTLDDNILKDIGVTKQDVLWASQLPMSEDAAKKLETVARRGK